MRTLALPLLLTSAGVACSGDPSGASTASDGSSTGGDGPVADDAEGADSSDDGSTTAPQVAGVRLLRDAHGVPHVVADTDEGAMYGLGWASAEDRLVPMTLTVLAAQGRLAEHFGPDYVGSDLRMRTMGLWRHAQRMADELDAEPRALLDAYARGVGDWIAAHPAPLLA
ncbi:MAG: penicillin acylase family protein, partial [Myxococcales bacterium]|nr:penicillin acylase family protein [Myxococcales bacterium]